METQEQILNELKELKSAVARLIGASDLPSKKQFSKPALDRVAQEFQKLSIERGQWIHTYDIQKVIKTAPYNPGRFLIDELEFARYFILGRSFYYNKEDLVELLREHGIEFDEKYLL